MIHKYLHRNIQLVFLNALELFYCTFYDIVLSGMYYAIFLILLFACVGLFDIFMDLM